nr:hypothetical transcript [Hymenolepis microstoma]
MFLFLQPRPLFRSLFIPDKEMHHSICLRLEGGRFPNIGRILNYHSSPEFTQLICSRKCVGMPFHYPNIA